LTKEIHIRGVLWRVKYDWRSLGLVVGHSLKYLWRVCHSLQSLLEEAATPGGVAAATTAKMDAAGYQRAIRQGVAAGLRRARANAGK